MRKNERIRYLDILKLLAIFVVFATHFVDRFNDSYVSLWHDAPTAWLLNGVNGKTGVAVFAVILGYFAYRSKEQNITKYTLKRYMYFLLCALFINSIYAIFGSLGIFDDSYTAKEVILTSLTLGAEIFRTFWCIRPFFIASVISRLNGKAGAGVLVILLDMLILYQLTGDVWVAICLMGNLAAVLMQREKIMGIFRHIWIRWPVYAAAFFLVKRPESDIKYVIDGACAMVLILAFSESRIIRKVLDWEPLASQGKNTMAMYLIHVVVYRLAGMAAGLNESSSPFMFAAVMAISWIVIVALSYPLTKMLDAATKLCMKPAEKLLQISEKLFEQQV